MSDSSLVSTFIQAMQPVFGLKPDSVPELVARTDRHDVLRIGNLDFAFDRDGGLISAFPVTELAVASIGAAALSLAQLMSRQFGLFPAVTLDRRLASFWFGTSLRPSGWEAPDVRDPVTGDYSTKDGWIRLHANAPHHRDAALRALGVDAYPHAVGQAAATWLAVDLETAIVQAGGCAAAMRSQQDWARHPQGKALAAEPLFHCRDTAQAAGETWTGTPSRPLSGLKVLDLTRVLAGPVCTRFLAGYGAQVLRIDPPFWNEPGQAAEVALGKHCAHLDLRDAAQREQFEQLLAQADVLVHGYRPSALDGLGLGAGRRQQIRPGLVDVSLDAYGWTGPWRDRRGFDSLVQMSSGIAHAGMLHFGQDKPVPLPVQALDQATGYLMAAAVLRGLAQRLVSHAGSTARLSLARTALLLVSQSVAQEAPFGPETADDLADGIERTSWGPAQRLAPPCRIGEVAMHWDHPASALGSHPAQWSSDGFGK